MDLINDGLLTQNKNNFCMPKKVEADGDLPSKKPKDRSPSSSTGACSPHPSRP